MLQPAGGLLDCAGKSRRLLLSQVSLPDVQPAAGRVDILRSYITAAVTSRSRAAVIGEGGPVIYCGELAEREEGERERETLPGHLSYICSCAARDAPAGAAVTLRS